MALLHSAYVRGAFRVPAPQSAGEVVAIRYEYTVPDDVSSGDIIELGVLPAHCRVVDMALDVDDLDDATAMELDVGLMSGEVGEALDEDGEARTSGDEFFDGDDTVQTGGVSRMSAVEGFRISPVDHDRSIGVKIATEAGDANEGVIGLTVWVGT